MSFSLCPQHLSSAWILRGDRVRAPKALRGGEGHGGYLDGHGNVWRAQFPDSQFLQHFEEDVGPDPQVQVFPKLLQFCQDLFGGPEILQIFREFGQQIKVPSISGREGQLGSFWKLRSGHIRSSYPFSFY